MYEEKGKTQKAGIHLPLYHKEDNEPTDSRQGKSLPRHHQTAYLSNFMFEIFFMLRGIGDSSIWAGYRYRGVFFFEQDLIR